MSPAPDPFLAPATSPPSLFEAEQGAAAGARKVGGSNEVNTFPPCARWKHPGAGEALSPQVTNLLFIILYLHSEPASLHDRT